MTFNNADKTIGDLADSINRATNSSVPGILTEVQAIRDLIDSKLNLQFIAAAVSISAVLGGAVTTTSVLIILKAKGLIHDFRHPAQTPVSQNVPSG